MFQPMVSLRFRAIVLFRFGLLLQVGWHRAAVLRLILVLLLKQENLSARLIQNLEVARIPKLSF